MIRDLALTGLRFRGHFIQFYDLNYPDVREFPGTETFTNFMSRLCFLGPPSTWVGSGSKPGATLDLRWMPEPSSQIKQSEGSWRETQRDTADLFLGPGL